MPLPHDDPASIVETRLVHEGQRRATSLLVDLLTAGPAPVPASAVSELRDFVVATLDHHHRLEDEDLWPTLLAADPGLAAPLRRLSADHQRLDAALSDLAAAPLGDEDEDGDGDGGDPGAAVAATAVRDLVHEHLAREEPVLFPALRAHVTDDGWAAFSRRATASVSPVGAHLMIGFLDQIGTDDQVELVFRHLPAPARAALPTARHEGRAALLALTAVVDAVDDRAARPGAAP